MSEKTKLYFQVIGILLVFIAGYLVLNYRPIVVGVLYRWAANDYRGAVLGLCLFIMQGGLLWLAFMLLPRLYLGILVFIVFLSGAVNLIYQQILGALLDAASMQWMLQEVGQLESAYKEFTKPFVIGLFESIFSVVLMLFSRLAFVRLRMAERCFIGVNFSYYKLSFVFLLLFVVVDLLMSNAGRSRAGEMNIYGLLIRQVTEVLPERSVPAVEPITEPVVEKIVLLIDESIGWSTYDKLLKPGWVSSFSGLDFGEVGSISNCSAQSNAAIRWGVDVENIVGTTDLRKNSTIWAYAKKAGYRTTLIDGQTLGRPQNYLWTSELALIDEFQSADKGIDTDYKIASTINKILLRPGRDYVYVVLRGAHYQYYGNYPNGELDRNLPKNIQYEKAVTYSKKNFMESLLNGVDRSNSIIFYTSDHGQYIYGDRVPHCNDIPMREEISVPLMMFAPQVLRDLYAAQFDQNINNSHSQIFPTSLALMGYEESYAVDAYDSLLPHGSKRLIRLGKKMYPKFDGDKIELFFNN